MMLVTLQEASDHLRLDSDADEADVLLKIRAASAAVRRYLKDASPFELDSNGDPVTDSNGDTVVLFEVRAAVLMMLGELYKNREGDQGGEVPSQWGYGYLPRPVVALLYPLRHPSMA